jgi:hypothetical protein
MRSRQGQQNKSNVYVVNCGSPSGTGMLITFSRSYLDHNTEKTSGSHERPRSKKEWARSTALRAHSGIQSPQEKGVKSTPRTQFDHIRSVAQAGAAQIHSNLVKSVYSCRPRCGPSGGLRRILTIPSTRMLRFIEDLATKWHHPNTHRRTPDRIAVKRLVTAASIGSTPRLPSSPESELRMRDAFTNGRDSDGPPMPK